jgi:hypothetical protein
LVVASTAAAWTEMTEKDVPQLVDDRHETSPILQDRPGEQIAEMQVGW